MLAGVDLPTEILLVRAFSAWFHLANVVQQVHQARHLERTAGRGGRLAEAVDRIEAEGVPSTLVDDVVRRLELRPVFTSHPTQAARRSVLSKMRQVAELLRARQDALPAERERIERRFAEVVDLLWQTDELRQGKPEPSEEASSIQYHLQELCRAVVPDILEDLSPGAGPPGGRARRRRPPPALRHVGRRRPGRQPQRHPPGHPRGPRHPARAGHRRPDRRRSTPSCAT